MGYGKHEKTQNMAKPDPNNSRIKCMQRGHVTVQKELRSRLRTRSIVLEVSTTTLEHTSFSISSIGVAAALAPHRRVFGIPSGHNGLGSLAAIDASPLAVNILTSWIADDNVSHPIIGGVDMKSAAFHVAVERQTQRSRCVHTKTDFAGTSAVCHSGAVGQAHTTCFVAAFAARRFGFGWTGGYSRCPLGSHMNLFDERVVAAAGAAYICIGVQRGPDVLLCDHFLATPNITIRLPATDPGWDDGVLGKDP